MTFPEVTIYTTATCGYCKATKELFTKHHVPYKEIDVSNDSAKAREMIEKSGQMGVPVTIVGTGPDQKTIIGFDQEALGTALGIKI